MHIDIFTLDKNKMDFITIFSAKQIISITPFKDLKRKPKNRVHINI